MPLFVQLSIGSAVIALTVVVGAVFAVIGVGAIDRAGAWMLRHPHWPRLTAVLIALTLWIQLAVTICVWIWSLLFLQLGLFASQEEAIYFSIVAFTTLGFGDILLDDDWRILSGLSAANGLLMFGFLTAFLVEVMRRLRQAQVTGDMQWTRQFSRRAAAPSDKEA